VGKFFCLLLLLLLHPNGSLCVLPVGSYLIHL